MVFRDVWLTDYSVKIKHYETSLQTLQAGNIAYWSCLLELFA